MRKLTLLFVLLTGFFLAAPALAQTGITTRSIETNWNKLTEEQKAAAAAKIAKEAAGNEVGFSGNVIPKDVSMDKVAPFLPLIDKIGDALVKLAKDLGVTANELLRTPVGAIAMGLIVYHVLGDEIMGILVGLLWLAVAMPVWLLLFYKWVIPVTGYKEVVLARSFGREPVKVSVPLRRGVTFEDDSGPEWVALITLVALMFITVCFIA